MKNNKNKDRFGFTMLELLVVIAIIGVLTALMIPAIGKVYEKGRIVQCVNNLKQLHTAAVSYSSANGGRLPYAATEDWKQIYMDNGEPNENLGRHSGWVAWFSESDRNTLWWNRNQTNGLQCIKNGSMFGHVGSDGDEAIYVCPSMSRLAKKTFNDERQNVTRSYGMNASVSGNNYYNIGGASRKIMFAEQGFEKQNGYQYALSDISADWTDPELPDTTEANVGYHVKRDYRNFDGCIDWGGKQEHIGEYHDGRGNAIFCDGHVERIKYDLTRYICTGNWENHKPIGDDPL